VFRAFFDVNKDGIQSVDIEKRIYYVSRRWTLRGPIPPGITIAHVDMPSKRHAMTVGQRRRIVRDAKGKRNV
jgi:hypothetical protein